MTPSKILVTGATGFIGSRLCERLALDHKLPYRALVRNFAHAPRIARLGSEMAAGSFDDQQALERALGGCDTVVHLADSEPSHTRTLVQASKRRGICRFVHISSIAVHGPQPDQSCSTERGATIGRYPGEDYSNRKAAAERIVQQAINGGFPAIILRPTIVYGPYGPFVKYVITATRISGVVTLLDEGSGVCNAVYVDDVCDAIVAAIQSDSGVGEAFFVNADRAVTWREFNLTFATMVHADAPVVNVRCDEVRAYWAARRPTLRTNASALARLAMSPDPSPAVVIGSARDGEREHGSLSGSRTRHA
jgi:nucleoside-diphosphate-sugar epimerase